MNHEGRRAGRKNPQQFAKNVHFLDNGNQKWQRLADDANDAQRSVAK